MYISRSLLALASILSFSIYADARVAQHHVDSASDSAWEEEKNRGSGFLQRWPLGNIFRKRQDDSTTVFDWTTVDVYRNILDNGEPSDIQTFCNIWLRIPPATEVVDVTPTITITTSAASTSIRRATTRVIVTETVTVTPAITSSAIVPRAVAAAYAVANEIITSVIESGTDDVGTAPAVAVTGLSQGCSAKMVDPTSTVTSTFTAPPEQITLGRNRLAVVTETTTRLYTTTTTITLRSIPETSSSLVVSSASNSTAPSSSDTASLSAAVLSSDSQLLSSGPQAIASVNLTTSSPTITNGPSISLVSSGFILPTASSAADSRPVVVGIPFSCPNGDKSTPRLIVGDLQYQYQVLCNTAIVPRDAITTIENVENEYACAAECSLINNAAQRSVCEAATFTPVPGASFGSCLISGPTKDFVPQPGTTTIVLTGVSSKADSCNSVDLLSGPNNVTIDVSALVASVTSASYSLSTPGLLSRSETGGVYTTFYSSGTTGTDGIYRYNWYQIYKSSSAWWEIYASSWSCSAGVPQTIVIPAVTTSGGSVFTTAFSTAYTSAVAGSGVESPGATATAPSGLLSSEAFTISSETAIFSSTGGFGEITPTASSTVSANANATTVPLPGSAALTVSGAIWTFNSTGGGGIGVQSQTTNAAELTVSGATSTFNSTGGAGAATPSQSTNGIELTVSGATWTSNFTGGAGAATPSASTSAIELTISTGISSAASEVLSPITANVTFIVTLSGATATANSTGGVGEETLSASSATSTEDSTSDEGGYAAWTGSSDSEQSTETESEGGFGAAGVTSNGTILPTDTPEAEGWTTTISGAIFTANSTGGQGIVTGTAAPSSRGPDFSNTDNLRSRRPSTPTPSPATGAQNVTVSGSTTFSSATQASGEVVPSGNVSSSAPATLTPGSSVNESASFGTGLFSTSGATLLVFSTGSFGEIPPTSAFVSETGTLRIAATPSVNSSLASGTGVLSTSGEIAINSGSGSSGAIQSPFANLTVTAPASITPASSSTSSDVITSAASGSGIIVSSLNSTTTPAPSLTLSQSPNDTISIGTAALTVSSETVVFSVASGSGVATLSVNITETPALSTSSNSSVSTGAVVLTISGETSVFTVDTGSGEIPPANSTVAPLASLTPSTSVNASTTLSETVPFSTGALTITNSGATTIILTTGGTGVVSPSANLTVTAPASLTTTQSLNASTTGDVFSNSGGDRIRSQRSTPASNTTLPGTTPVGTASSAPVFLSSTTVSASIELSSTTEDVGYEDVPSETPSAPISLNITSTSGSAQPSITLPPTSLNSSATPPPLNTSTGSYNPDEDDRIGRSRSRSQTPGLTSNPPALTANTTLTGTAPPLTAVSAVPSAPANSSAPISLGTIVPSVLSSTEISVGTALSSSTPVTSTNSSAPVGTASGPVPTPPLFTGASESIGISSATANFTSAFGTGVIAVPTPSANFTITLSIGEVESSTVSEDEGGGFSFQQVTESSVIPTESANSTSIWLTGVTAPSSIVPTTSASVSFPVASANSTSAFLTGVTAPSSAFPTPFASSTGSVASTTVSPITVNATSFPATGTNTASSRSTEFPISSTNATIPASLLSAGPTACPTEVSYSTVLRTTVITEVLPIGPSSCVPTAPVPLTLNSTLVTGTELPAIPTSTGLTALPLAAYTTSTFEANTPTPAAAPPRRRQGELATQDQIDYACADSGNQVLNPNFESDEGTTPVDWTVIPEDAYITFRTGPSTNTDGTTTNTARVLSGAAGRSLTVSQPLTLCPGHQYRFSSFNRQANLLSKCVSTYSYGDIVVYTSSPQEVYSKREVLFTAGTSVNDVSQDLRITTKCEGEGGALVGADDEGFMVAEFNGISVTPVLEG